MIEAGTQVRVTVVVNDQGGIDGLVTVQRGQVHISGNLRAPLSTAVSGLTASGLMNYVSSLIEVGINSRQPTKLVKKALDLSEVYEDMPLF